MISVLNKGGAFYNGSAPRLIDYAIIPQDDDEFFVFDKPVNNTRVVYRLDKTKQVIGIIDVTQAEKVTQLK